MPTRTSGMSLEDRLRQDARSDRKHRRQRNLPGPGIDQLRYAHHMDRKRAGEDLAARLAADRKYVHAMEQYKAAKEARDAANAAAAGSVPSSLPAPLAAPIQQSHAALPVAPAAPAPPVVSYFPAAPAQPFDPFPSAAPFPPAAPSQQVVPALSNDLDLDYIFAQPAAPVLAPAAGWGSVLNLQNLSAQPSSPYWNIEGNLPWNSAFAPHSDSSSMAVSGSSSRSTPPTSADSAHFSPRSLSPDFGTLTLPRSGNNQAVPTQQNVSVSLYPAAGRVTPVAASFVAAFDAAADARLAVAPARFSAPAVPSLGDERFVPGAYDSFMGAGMVSNPGEQGHGTDDGMDFDDDMWLLDFEDVGTEDPANAPTVPSTPQYIDLTQSEEDYDIYGELGPIAEWNSNNP